MIFIVYGLVVLLIVMLIRTLMFRPELASKKSKEPDAKDALAIAQRLSQMIQCETVSSPVASQVNEGQFKWFKTLIEDLYPLVHETCDRSFHGPTGILYHWKGKSNSDVTVLMSHYDVVPCDETLWTVPPFSGLIKDGMVWGRGTLDTKGTLCGILEAAESLMAKGFVPENDIYFSFSGDEEIQGPSAPAIVEHLQAQGIRPTLVLDEGGAIVERIFPGVEAPVAVIGIGEKGYLDLELSLEGKGGHASMPPAHTLVGQLSQAVVNLERHPFKAHITPPVKAMLTTLGRHSTFLYRFIFANLWCFAPLLKVLFSKQGGEMNALIRTTTAATKMSGSKAYNVLSSQASVGLNFRLLDTETVEQVVDYVKKTIKNPEIQVKAIHAIEASKVSSVESDGWRCIESAIHDTWDSVIVAPYLMFAATDSRHYCGISDHVFRFSAMSMSKEERGLIHGHDERIQIKNLVQAVHFFEHVIYSR